MQLELAVDPESGWSSLVCVLAAELYSDLPTRVHTCIYTETHGIVHVVMHDCNCTSEGEEIYPVHVHCTKST